MRIQVYDEMTLKGLSNTIIELIKDADERLAQSAEVLIEPEKKILTIYWKRITWYEYFMESYQDDFKGVVRIERIISILEEHAEKTGWHTFDNTCAFISQELSPFKDCIRGFQSICLGKEWDDYEEHFGGYLDFPLGFSHRIEYKF